MTYDYKFVERLLADGDDTLWRAAKTIEAMNADYEQLAKHHYNFTFETRDIIAGGADLDNCHPYINVSSTDKDSVMRCLDREKHSIIKSCSKLREIAEERGHLNSKGLSTSQLLKWALEQLEKENEDEEIY